MFRLKFANPSGSAVKSDSLESVRLVPSGGASGSEKGSSGSTNSPGSSVSQRELSESTAVQSNSSSNNVFASIDTSGVSP